MRLDARVLLRPETIQLAHLNGALMCCSVTVVCAVIVMVFFLYFWVMCIQLQVYLHPCICALHSVHAGLQRYAYTSGIVRMSALCVMGISLAWGCPRPMQPAFEYICWVQMYSPWETIHHGDQNGLVWPLSSPIAPIRADHSPYAGHCWYTVHQGPHHPPYIPVTAHIHGFVPFLSLSIYSSSRHHISWSPPIPWILSLNWSLTIHWFFVLYLDIAALVIPCCKAVFHQ